MEGKMIGIKVDGQWINCEWDSSLNIETEMQEVSANGNKGWKDFIEGYQSWGMSVTARMTNGTTMGSWNKIVTKVLQRGGKFEVAFRAREGEAQSFVFEGLALIPSIGLSAPMEGSASYNLTFQGCGELQLKNVTDVWQIINAIPAEDDKNIIIYT